MEKKVLIIASVWPESSSSAAGYRMQQLLGEFIKAGYKVTYASTAAPSIYADEIPQVAYLQFSLNDSAINEALLQIAPDIVVFDRFMVEEQFGWRVNELCPNALRILNTEDLHCLRNTREAAVKAGLVWDSAMLLTSDFAKREIAAILRCDLSLIISAYELGILKAVFKIDEKQLFYLPFNGAEQAAIKTFVEREHFVWIGNFKHKPNWDAVLQLKQHIWPQLRKNIPTAQIHVYGAYTDDKAQQLNNKKEGFLIKGRAENALEVIANAKVCIAPLRFGAGLKGKLFEAMQVGTPTVTTRIGAEGMCDDVKLWNGHVTDNWNDFIHQATYLYEDEKQWQIAQNKGKALLKKYFSNPSLYPSLIKQFDFIGHNLKYHREQNFYGSLLRHHQYQSTRFMSKWIEEKNKPSSK